MCALVDDTDAMVGKKDCIAMFASDLARERVSLVADSDEAERLWLQVHTNQGPLLLGAWYKPPSPGEVGSILSFQKEYLEHSCSCIGAVLVGDINVHQESWLRFSSGNTVEGK